MKEPRKWTNTAQNPTKWNFKEGFGQLSDAGIPSCMHQDVANFLRYPKIFSEPVMVTDGKVFTKKHDFKTTFEMSYGASATFEKTQAAKNVVAIGYQRSFTCGGETLHLGWFPKCSNAAKFTINEGAEIWGGYSGGGGGSTYYAPIGSSMSLVLLGLVLIGGIRKWRN